MQTCEGKDIDEQNFQLKTKIQMKYKFSINRLTLAFASLLLCVVSCIEPKNNTLQENKPKRKYEVRLSNHIGSDWYECDSIIRVSENRIQLKNNEDLSFFIDITIPENVVLRVYPK